jgi:hypothetical protein
VLAEIGCEVRINERRYGLWKWSVLPWLLASPGIVGAGIGSGGRGGGERVLTVEVVGYSVVACVA